MKFIFFSFFLLVAGFMPALVCAQQDDDVRGAFLTTRPKAPAKGTNPAPATRPSHRRPKTITTKSSGTTTASTKNGSTPVGATPAKINTARLGLGLTLFMRDSNGLAVRTDPAHEFRKGDHVRFLIETNTDGYLYVFNTTDGGPATMIYPDPELDDGGNFFESHVPFEIPSSVAAEERLRWMTFDEHSGAEKLYFVFTREPLPGVPIEDDLVTYCRENDNPWPWHPSAASWAQIKMAASEPVQIAKGEGMGRAQTSVEHRAATRGIGLNRDDPEPSLIMLTASTSKNMLVAAVDLIHKPASMVNNEEE